LLGVARVADLNRSHVRLRSTELDR
jgi:hypothetical protein